MTPKQSIHPGSGKVHIAVAENLEEIHVHGAQDVPKKTLCGIKFVAQRSNKGLTAEKAVTCLSCRRILHGRTIKMLKPIRRVVRVVGCKMIPS